MPNKQKKGAGVAARRAEEALRDKQLVNELNHLQEEFAAQCDIISWLAAEKAEIVRALKRPDSNLKRRIEAAKIALRSLAEAREKAALSVSLTKGEAALDKLYAVAKQIAICSGVSELIFLDKINNWFILHKGRWLRRSWSTVKTMLIFFGISNTRKACYNALSEIELVRLYFTNTSIELTPEVKRAIKAGERMTKVEIVRRCSRDFVSDASSTDTLYREFGPWEDSNE